MSDPTGGWAAATTETIKALRDVGRAIAEPAQQLIGMGSDYLKVVRFERQLRLVDRVRAAMHARKLSALNRPIPLNTLVPLIEHAEREEDDHLQDTWAEMLVNAGDADSPVEPRRAFVTMLSEMSAFDVRNLATIHEGECNPDTGMIWTLQLPEKALAVPENYVGLTLREDVEVSLGNLQRLGCLLFASGLGEVPLPAFVVMTALGRAFIRACTAPALK